MNRDHWLCVPCLKAGKISDAIEVDHIVPRSQGGTNDLENLQSICGTCHEEKSVAESPNYKERAVIGIDGAPENW